MNHQVKGPLTNAIHLYPAQFKLDVLNYMNEHGTSIRETAAHFQYSVL